MEAFDFVLKPLHVWDSKMLERTVLVVVVKDQLAVLHWALTEQLLIDHVLAEHRTVNQLLIYMTSSQYTVNYDGCIMLTMIPDRNNTGEEDLGQFMVLEDSVCD